MPEPELDPRPRAHGDTAAASSVWAPENRGLAIGLVLTITMVAFENLGVGTAMPVVARDLDGLSLYGWAFTSTLLASVVGIAFGGRQTDRHGPGRPFLLGLALFATGLTIAALAPTMPVLVAGRFVQGLGTGVIPPVAYASIGRAFADRARARMFALLSTAWVLPGVVGPAVSGAVAEAIGWRWVFAGILPLVPVNLLLAAPALLRLGPPPRDDLRRTGEGVLGHAAALAAGMGLVIAGLSTIRTWTLPLVATGLAVAARPTRQLLPRGTFRAAAGIPAAIGARGLQTFAFFGAGAFVPLALTALRGDAAWVAGLTVTASTLSWTAGAWIQERRGHVWGRRATARRGFAALTAGVAIAALVVVPSVPQVVASMGWAMAGLGMGMSYSGLSLLVLADAPPGQEGTATSSLQLADVLGMALGTGLGGAAVAVARAASAGLRPGIAVAFGLSWLAALGALVASRRLHEHRVRTEVVVPASGEGAAR